MSPFLFLFFFFKFLGSKCPKLLLNAHFGPQIHALDSILPTVNTESGLKGLFTVCGGQHSKRYQPKRQNRHFRESKDSVFFFFFFVCLFAFFFFVFVSKPGLFHK